MTRIYEALVLAQQESLVDTHSKALVKTNKELDPGIYEKLLFMHERIVEKKGAGKYLHFIGLSNNQDERTLILLYARLLSENMKKRVAVCMGFSKEKKIKKQANPHESNGTLGYMHEIEPEFVDRLLEGESWNNGIDNKGNEMDYYDCILIYSSMQKSVLLPLLLTKVVPDTVLMLNSETIKYDEVETYIKKIKHSGGNLLGIVMNKIVPYIPTTVEKYL